MEHTSNDMRVSVTVRLEKTSDRVIHHTLRGTREAQGKVWIDTTFDECKLNSQIVFSGDYTIAQGIYDERYRLTPESDLLDAETGEKIKWY